jgi:drug/metabolite transporter (DMT)-like permease
MKTTGLGILAAMGAATCFSIIDMLFKFLSGDYPLYEVVFIRSVVALAVLLGILMPLEGGFHLIRTRKLKLHLMRSVAVLFANLCFFTGLAIMPLAEAVAIAFATPLVVTLLSVIFLKETVGPWRWGAIAGGFIGILVIMRPGADTFQAAAILPLLGACGYATLHVLTRSAGGTEKAATLSFYPTFGFLVVSSLVGLILGGGQLATGGESAALDFIFRAWKWPASQDWIYFVGVGLAGSVGGYLVSQAYRLCEATLIAPFEYVAMPLAIVWGVMFFEEWPELPVWIGSGLIIGSGLVSVWRETRRNRAPGRARPRSTG